LVVDARTMNEGDGWSGSGANPWHLDKQTESILFLTNESDKPARIGFSVTVASASSPTGSGGQRQRAELFLSGHGAVRASALGGVQL
jgi:hypothetical protein